MPGARAALAQASRALRLNSLCPRGTARLCTHLLLTPRTRVSPSAVVGVRSSRAGLTLPPPHGAESVRSRYISPRPPRATGGETRRRELSVETHMRCEATPFSVLNGVRRCQATVLKEGRKEGYTLSALSRL